MSHPSPLVRSRHSEHTIRILAALVLTGVYYGLAVGLSMRLSITGYNLIRHHSEWLLGGLVLCAAKGFSSATMGARIAVLLAQFRSRENTWDTSLAMAADQPALHELVRSVAKDLNEPMPTRIYLGQVANAWSYLNSFLGFHVSWTGIGIGIPLLATLTPEQLRAVVAHELGHLRSIRDRTDVWQRWALVSFYINQRTFEASRGWQFLIAPQLWYSWAMMRLTWPVATTEELVADEAALAVQPAMDHAMALAGIAATQVMFQDYLIRRIRHDAAVSRSVNLYEGFRTYVASSSALSWNEALDIYNGRDQQRTAARALMGRRTARIFTMGEPCRGCSIMPATDTCPHPDLQSRIDYIHGLTARWVAERPWARPSVYVPNVGWEAAMGREVTNNFSRSGSLHVVMQAWSFDLPSARADAAPDLNTTVMTRRTMREKRAAARAV